MHPFQREVATSYEVWLMKRECRAFCSCMFTFDCLRFHMQLFWFYEFVCNNDLIQVIDAVSIYACNDLKSLSTFGILHIWDLKKKNENFEIYFERSTATCQSWLFSQLKGMFTFQHQFKPDLITSVEILGCTTLKKKKLLPQFQCVNSHRHAAVVTTVKSFPVCWSAVRLFLYSGKI